MVPYMQRQKSMGGGKTRRTKKKGKEKSLRETKSYTKKKRKVWRLGQEKKTKSMAKQRRKSWKIRTTRIDFYAITQAKQLKKKNYAKRQGIQNPMIQKLRMFLQIGN